MSHRLTHRASRMLRNGLLVGTASLALSACGENPAASRASAEVLVESAADAEAKPYIVRMNDQLVGLQRVEHVVASTLSLIGAESALFTYDTVFKGFAARLTDRQVGALERLPLIASVNPDQLVTLSATQTAPVYGLDRIDEYALPLDGEYAYPDSAGAGVHVYILDTGINPDHQEFNGRIGAGRNFINDGPLGVDSLLILTRDAVWSLLGYQPDPDNWQDCNGHGTHVAGTAVGTLYGVAKQATVHPVRVLGCGGSGSFAAIIAGMEWVAENAERPAVVNMSIGGGSSEDINVATNALFDAGILPVVAAGNNDTDACSSSPAAAVKAVTVGSSDSSDRESSFSNHGSCVDIFAPGSDVISADYSNNTGTSVLSGTSMASPHVAGAAALLLGEMPSLSPGDITSTLLSNATSGALALSPTDVGSPNLLLNVYPQGAKP